MATTPQLGPTIPIGPPHNERLPVKAVPPTTLKPPYYIGAIRSPKDRNYAPRYDLS